MSTVTLAEEADTSLLWPVVGASAIAGFGPAGVGPSDGIDIRGNAGAPILASREGSVRVLPVAEGGSLIVIDSGESVSSYRPVADSTLTDGEEITQGTPLGTVTDGGILHFRFQRRSESGRLIPTDPVPLLASRHSSERALRLGVPLESKRAASPSKLPSDTTAAEVAKVKDLENPLSTREQEARAALSRNGPQSDELAPELANARGDDVTPARGGALGKSAQTRPAETIDAAAAQNRPATAVAPEASRSEPLPLPPVAAARAEEPAIKPDQIGWRTVSTIKLSVGTATLEQGPDRMRIRIANGGKVLLTEEANRISISDSKLLKKSQVPAGDRNLVAIATFAGAGDQAIVSIYELTPAFKRRLQIATTLTGRPQLEDRNSDGTVELVAKVPVPSCAAPGSESKPAIQPLELVYRLSPRAQLSLRMSEPYPISNEDLRALASELRPKIEQSPESGAQSRAFNTVVRTAYYLARVDRRSDAIRFLGDTIGSTKSEKLRARMVSCILGTDERSRSADAQPVRGRTARAPVAKRSR